MGYLTFLGATEYVDDEGNLVRCEDYFDESTGMPDFKMTVLKYGYRKVMPEVELGRRVVRSFTGADIEVRTFRNKFGEIQTEETVLRLNNGDDDDCPPDGRGW